MDRVLETDAGHLVHGTLLAVVEPVEIRRLEAQCTGEPHGRESLASGVVPGDRRIQRTARCGQLVLDMREAAAG